MTSVGSVRSPSTPPKSAVPYNTPGAALKGASTAFSKPSVKPKPSFPTYVGANGALIAATKAGSQQNSPTYNHSYAESVSRQSTGNSTRQSTTSPSPSRWQLRTHASSDTLQLPSDSASSRTISPSNIAATLAAARHTPIASKIQQRPGQAPSWTDEMKDTMRGAHSAAQRAAAQKVSVDITKQQRNLSQGSATFPAAQDKPTDETSIPPTSALVKLFEQARSNNGTDSAIPETPSTPETTISRPIILSPTPRRTFSVKKVEDEKRVQKAANEVNKQLSSNSAPEPAPKPKRLLSTKSLSKEKLATPQKTAATAHETPKTKPIDIPGRRTVVDRPAELSPASSYASAAETVDEVPETKAPRIKPEPPPPRRVGKSHTASRTATSVSPPKLIPLNTHRYNPLQPQRTAEPYMRPTSVPNSAYGRENLQRITVHMTGDSLANAIVGAALASSMNPSRQLSPVRTTAPPLPRRHEKPSHAHHNWLGKSRTPSPAKQPGKLRQTMRKEESSDSSSDNNHHKRKGMFRRKHPNKHHEGARKRWRDAITAHERKRYEGVWAANKGVYISLDSIEPHKRFGNETSDVLDLVVRDIWSRSRLQEHVLAEVWDLVDTRKVGRLTREEFVVGLWLVDQRLKGRKLPTRVQETVWASVTGAGVKIKYRK